MKPTVPRQRSYLVNSQDLNKETRRKLFEERGKHSDLDFTHSNYPGSDEYMSVSTERAYEIWCDAWNAALANTQMGGMFNVGDKALRFEAGTTWISGMILFLPDTIGWYSFTEEQKTALSFKSTDKFRPAPKTVDLTTEEKVRAINEKGGLNAFDIIDRIQGGKTLDQLCAAYGVETTRRM